MQVPSLLLCSNPISIRLLTTALNAGAKLYEENTILCKNQVANSWACQAVLRTCVYSTVLFQNGTSHDYFLFEKSLVALRYFTADIKSFCTLASCWGCSNCYVVIYMRLTSAGTWNFAVLYVWADLWKQWWCLHIPDVSILEAFASSAEHIVCAAVPF